MTFRPAAALLTALAIAACSKKPADAPATGPVAAVAPPAGKQWSDVVQATPEGGMRIGNPAAPVKFVEYASFTCPHCKHFEDEGADALLTKYIPSGKVSWEFRSTLIHSPDAPITLLMNCRGPDPFFTLAKQLYAGQDGWLGKIVAVPAAEQQRWQGLAPADQFKVMMEAGGLYAFFAARGLPRAKADTCLADQKAIDAMTAAQQRYSTVDNITATPTFFINGQMRSDLSEWKAVDRTLASMTR